MLLGITVAVDVSCVILFFLLFLPPVVVVIVISLAFSSLSVVLVAVR